ARVSQVAFHPDVAVLALGYDDGFVLLCRLTDASEILVRREDPDGGGISALAWDHNGRRLLFGTSEGRPGLLTLPQSAADKSSGRDSPRGAPAKPRSPDAYQSHQSQYHCFYDAHDRLGGRGGRGARDDDRGRHITGRPGVDRRSLR